MRLLVETKEGTFKRFIAERRTIVKMFEPIGYPIHLVSPSETFEEAIARINEDRKPQQKGKAKAKKK